MVRCEQLDLDELSKLFASKKDVSKVNILNILSNLSAYELEQIGITTSYLINKIDINTIIENYISGDLTDIHNDINSINREIRTLKEADNTLQLNINNNTNLIENIRTECKNYTDTKYSNAISYVDSKILDVTNNINSINTNLTKEITQLKNKDTTLQSNIDKVQSNLDATNTNITNINKNLTNLINTNKTNITNNTNSINSLKTSVKTNTDNIATLTTNLTNLTTKVGTAVFVHRGTTQPANKDWIWVDTSVSPNIVRFYVNNKWTGMNTYA